MTFFWYGLQQCEGVEGSPSAKLLGKPKVFVGMDLLFEHLAGYQAHYINEGYANMHYREPCSTLYVAEGCF